MEAYPTRGTFDEFEAAVALVKADDERKAAQAREQEEREARAAQAEADAEGQAVERAQRELQCERDRISHKIRGAVAVLRDDHSDALSRKYAEAVCAQYNIDESADVEARLRLLATPAADAPK